MLIDTLSGGSILAEQTNASEDVCVAKPTVLMSQEHLACLLARRTVIFLVTASHRAMSDDTRLLVEQRKLPRL